jgi:hypothetical protein
MFLRDFLAKGLSKQANVPLSPEHYNLLAQTGLRVGLPVGAAYLIGRIAGSAGGPSDDEISAIQAAVVNSRLQDAISDLDKKKRIEMLKSKLESKTLRL